MDKSRRGGVTVHRRGAGWELYCRISGKRIRKIFPTQDEARAAGLALVNEARMHGADAFQLSVAARVDAAKALAMLPAGVPLVDAAAAWLASRKAVETPPLVDAVSAWLAGKRATGRREKTIAGYAHFADRLLSHFPGERVGDVTGARLEAWFEALGLSGETWNWHRRVASSLFGWCVRKGLASGNAAGMIEVAIIDRGGVEILTTAQSAALMRAAEKLRPTMLPYLALGLFAGLRPTELRRLDWRAVEPSHIRIGSGVAKARSMRLVDVRPTLAAWLDGRRRESGAIEYSRRHLREVVDAAGIEWTPDILRHTFASMHLADGGDPAATAFQLGHAGIAVLDTHYKALVSQVEARAFWRIAPTKKASSRAQAL